MTDHATPGGEPSIAPAEVQARLAAIVESSDDAIVSKTLDGIITSWNKGAERIFGYTAAEVIGKSILVLIPPDRQSEEPQILARLQRGERVDHFETIRMRKDGRLIEVSVTISPLRDATGRIIGASKIARDITDQKQSERELRAARDAAESARAEAESLKELAEQANRAKDHFLSVLSHELRTPLTPVLAAVSMLEEAPTLTLEEVRSTVEMIRRNVETEARLVDDLLDITRISRGKIRLHMEVVDVHVVMRNVVNMLQSEIDDKRLAVTLALRAGEHVIWADAGRFQQVLLNLLSNAVKFTPADGTITLRTSDNTDSTLPLCIEIVDNGVGIESDVLPRLFKAFEQGEQTVTRKFGGLGLGLSIVRSLVHMHGGQIEAHSAGQGQGARFSISMPVVTHPQLTSGRRTPLDDASAAPKSLSSTDQGVSDGKPRVLLVEDHDDTRRMLSKMLGACGCSVTAAANVREAIDLADRQPFDLLFSDIGLPDGSGLDVVRSVRAKQDIPGIALSGFGQDEDIRRSREAGFERHLTKPVNLQTLRDVIREVAS